MFVLATGNWQVLHQCYIFHIRQQKKIKKEHRSVVLPEFQGVGIGNAFTSYIAKMWKLQGYRYTSVTSNPSMIMARKNSKAWKCVRFGRTSQSTGILKGTASSARITASFEYIG